MQETLVFHQQVRLLEHHPRPPGVVEPLPLRQLLLLLGAATDRGARHREDLVAQGLGEQGVAWVPRIGAKELQDGIQISIWGRK